MSVPNRHWSCFSTVPDSFLCSQLSYAATLWGICAYFSPVPTVCTAPACSLLLLRKHLPVPWDSCCTHLSCECFPPLVLDDVPMILEHVDLWNYCIYESFQKCLPTKSDAYLPLRLMSSGSPSPVLLGLWPRRMLSVTGERRMQECFPDSLGDPQRVGAVWV